MFDENPGKNPLVWIVIVLAVVVMMLVLRAFTFYPECYDTLNKKLQDVKSRESGYSAALNIVPEKIKGSWALCNQFLNHESDTHKQVAANRNSALAALQLYKEMKAKGENPEAMLKQAKVIEQSLMEYQKSASLAINVVTESTPNLKGSETVKDAMRSLQEGVNEIKVALDDKIKATEDYNEYRGRFWVSIYASSMKKFPEQIEFYKGEVEKLDIDKLNPQKQDK